MKTQVKLMHKDAEMPKRAHQSDTGYDLKFIGVDKIEGDVIFFKTGLQICPPEGHYFEVVPRSSISKLPLSMANSVGVIDQHYRGEIIVPVRVQHKECGFDVKNVTFPGGVVKIFGRTPQSMTDLAKLILFEKPILFQAILRKRLDCDFEEVEVLDETKRGSGGFGSTDGFKTKKKEETTIPKE